MSCPNCFSGSLHAGEAKGTIEDLYGFKTYVAMPPSTDNLSKSNIIFFCDAFGLNLVNSKILADVYAEKTNCRVLVPDIIPGGGAPLAMLHGFNTLMKPSETWAGALNPVTLLRKGFALAWIIGNGLPFMIRGSAPKAFPACLKYARDVRADMAPEGKLGVAGFCWGAYPCTKLCCEPAVEGGSTRLIDAQFNAHPSFLKSPDDIVAAVSTYKVPYTVAVAESDMAGFDKAASEKCDAVLKEKFPNGGVTYQFTVHKGCHHGFAVRASHDEGDVGKDGYEGAAKQAVEWFNKYLN